MFCSSTSNSYIYFFFNFYCWNAFDLCVLILYPATLLNSFINSNSFFVDPFGSVRYRIISSANSDNLSSSFPIFMPLISFVCLIALASVSRTMLNRSGERGHPCLVPDLRGNAFNFSPFRMMLACGLS
uniref:Uncharacterized protein n=1 Tax=Spermophilus dauricus TaxID=99837 RepID=A0A8C9PST4_SPEDA